MPISVGSICSIEAEASVTLAPAHAQAEQAVREAPVKNADETGWSLAGNLCWLWMAATQSVAFFNICAGRGRASFRELLGQSVQGILCTDRWGAYNIVDLAMRQLCWAHPGADSGGGLNSYEDSWVWMVACSGTPAGGWAENPFSALLRWESLPACVRERILCATKLGKGG